MPVNTLYGSPPLGGHFLAPFGMPSPLKDEIAFGPSTAAPSKMGGFPSSEPTRFATWCCRQSENVLPSPTINETPQTLSPSTQLRCVRPNVSYVFTPASSS